MEICSTPSRPVHPPSPSSPPARTQGLDRLAGGGANSRRLRPSTSRWGGGAGPGGQVGSRGQGGPGPGLKPWALPGAWQKLQEYLSGRSILAKLQAKHEKLQDAIQRGGPPCLATPRAGSSPATVWLSSCGFFLARECAGHAGRKPARVPAPILPFVLRPPSPVGCPVPLPCAEKPPGPRGTPTLSPCQVTRKTGR